MIGLQTSNKADRSGRDLRPNIQPARIRLLNDIQTIAPLIGPICILYQCKCATATTGTGDFRKQLNFLLCRPMLGTSHITYDTCRYRLKHTFARRFHGCPDGYQFSLLCKRARYGLAQN